MPDLPKSSGSTESPSSVDGRAAPAVAIESALSAIRLWACAGAGVGFEGSARHEPLLSTGQVVVTLNGGITTIYFRDERGTLKPFPRGCLAVVSGDQFGGLKMWNTHREWFQVYGGSGTVALWYIAVGY